MRDRQAALRGLLAGERDDRRHLLRGELGRCSASLVICQHGQDQLLKILVRSAFVFGVGKGRSRLGPSVSPATYALSVDAQHFCLLKVVAPFGREQDDAAAFNQLLRR